MHRFGAKHYRDSLTDSDAGLHTVGASSCAVGQCDGRRGARDVDHSRSQHVGRPDEAGHKHGCRSAVYLAGGPYLLNSSLAHDRYAVAHAERLFLIVGHQHERGARLALNPFKFELHDLAQLLV